MLIDVCFVSFSHIVFRAALRRLSVRALKHILHRIVWFYCSKSSVYQSGLGGCETEQSRRDDLEALGYMFIYFLRGGLPWQGVKGTTTPIDRYRRVAQCKQKTAIDQLCSGLPSQ